MSDQEMIVDHRYLLDWTTRVLVALGMPEGDAAVVADSLVDADLSGVDTHGVVRLPGYAKRLQSGGDNPRPDIRVVRENPATALLDGDGCMGQVGGVRAMRVAIEKAEAGGVGIVAIRGCNHFGAAGYYAAMASERGLIGAAMTNVMASMPPVGGAARRLGNNPYALAFPTNDEPPILIDAATSKASWGRLHLCRETGEPLPEGCFIDAEGNPTRNPNDVLAGGALLPAGGAMGYGLSLAIEMLTGILAGAPVSDAVRHDAATEKRGKGYSFLMAAMRIDCFNDPDRFRADADAWVRHIRATPRAPGADPIRIPGERRFRTRAERLESGIPLLAPTIRRLRDLGDETGVAFQANN